MSISYALSASGREEGAEFHPSNLPSGRFLRKRGPTESGGAASRTFYMKLMN